MSENSENITEHDILINSIIIIESLNNDEMKTGKQLHDDIEAWMSSHPLNLQFYSVATHSDLFNLIDRLTSFAKSANGTMPLCPVVHIECHGSNDGIQLTHDFIVWDDLKPHLRQLNIATQNRLIFSLASCFGIVAAPQIDISEPCPSFLTIGPQEEISTGNLRDAYQRFFRTLCDTRGDIHAAIVAANANKTSEFRFLSMVTSEMMFDIGEQHWRSLNSSRRQISTRTNRLLSQWREEIHPNDPRPLSEQRAAIKSNVRQQAKSPAFLEKMFRHFVMSDRFESCEKRFPFDFNKYQARAWPKGGR